MDRSDRLELIDITVETFRFQTENFFSKLTAEQWNLLKSETPDSDTKFLLAELLLNLTSSVSMDLVKEHGHSHLPLTPESVQASLGDALRQGLAPGSLEKSVSLDQLTDLVAEEITERVNSHLSECSTSAGSTGPTQSHMTAPNKLEEMICCVCKVLISAPNIEELFKPKLCSQKTFDIIDELPQWETSTLDSSCTDRSISSVSRVSSKDVSEITVPLVDEVFESVLTELLSESFSPESKSISDEISEIVSEENSVKTSESSRSSKSLKSDSFWKGVGKKIKEVMSKVFATVSMIKMGAQVRKDVMEETNVERRESIKPVMDSVEALVLTEMEPTNSPESVKALKEELSVVLYNFVTNGNLKMSPGAVMTDVVPEAHKKMYMEIQEKVFSYLLLIGWWFLIQAGDNTNKVTSVVTETESITESPVSENDSAKYLEESRKKKYINLFINLLVTRVYAKAKVDQSCYDPRDVTQNLFEKTWAEVQDFDADFEISPEIIVNLQKPVFKDLCKKWSCPEMLLVAICKKEPEVERSIATSMKSNMSKRSRAFFKW
nr:PREDICTED: uncharacterized protein LOC109644599 [Paralichthys olivaceus]